METVTVSIFEPKMPIIHDKGALYHTGVEDGTATVKRAGFPDLVLPNVIPETSVWRSILPVKIVDGELLVAVVSACVGKDDAGTLVSKLPEENVVLKSIAPLVLTAKEIVATDTFTDPRDGAVFVGNVVYGDCDVALSGGAASLTATGTLQRIS